MNRRDLKRLKIDPNFVISPDKFITMFGVETEGFTKLDIHDMHYVLGDSINHAGVNQISLDKISRGEIYLVGNPNNFKVYYRPIKYKVKINNKITEEIESTTLDITHISLSELCKLCIDADNIEDLDKYVTEIYERVNCSLEDELESNKVKIYSLPTKSRKYS